MSSLEHYETIPAQTKTLRERRDIALKPRALRVNDFCALYGLSRSSAYKLIESRKIESVVIEGRRLILADSAERLLSGGEAK